MDTTHMPRMNRTPLTPQATTAKLLQQRKIYAYEVKGSRHDTGNKLGYLKAMVYFAMKRPDLAEAFGEYLTALNLLPAERR